MEPFPTLKRSWEEPQLRFLRRIKSLEDEEYRKRGYQLEDTERTYPEATQGLPVDEWPQELQDIWNGYERDFRRIEKEKDFCYEEIERLEKVLHPLLDPLEFRYFEMHAGFEIQRRNRLKELPLWGLDNLLTKEQREEIQQKAWEYHNNGGVSNKWYPMPDIPAELIDARIVGEKEIMDITRHLADKGTLWIENQERMLLGLDTIFF